MAFHCLASRLAISSSDCIVRATCVMTGLPVFLELQSEFSRISIDGDWRCCQQKHETFGVAKYSQKFVAACGQVYSNLKFLFARVIYPIAYPYDIASFNSTLFWTDWMNNKVQWIGMDYKDPGVPLKTYIGQSGKIFDVKAVQPCPKKASAKYPCEVNNGGCMGLCLLRPGGHTCSCPVHMYTVTTDKGTICKDKCEDPLGIEEGIIEDAQMIASSAWNNNFNSDGAHRARINLEFWPAGWNAKRFDPDPWLQIDLGIYPLFKAEMAEEPGDIQDSTTIRSKLYVRSGLMECLLAALVGSIPGSPYTCQDHLVPYTSSGNQELVN
ncbi:predicted protein [Nematostella vectensis]|uniref:F5/8 type C domain-containing protein n=1 Tax=Nematostella vectensis TaxID=45351 RepID=A7ST27_NEMVE|nr:predicted protein [Nematostella vectensis]|eukprot:XP_001625227.1 predicted protein [Nematostella vectensis]